ncbi:MAG: peptidylprolyl isomerase [Sulfuricaulis sp.]|uniref:peptidylprolyl isomerase n=1 Tax=Sulfuricaulis sp. TaxID=2003553 RepID=UPI0025D574BC|nr:peptidylprolyl isomerase [Sulfuricaulis sp.]MCR4345630.1 peptidylprolyl isomerase [Sulfuricaulis sp.]
MKVSSLISLIVIFFRCHGRGRAYWRITACAAIASALSSPLLTANTIVRMEINFGNTPAGNIDIELYDDQAPITVTNFLHYAGSGRYTTNGFIHRHATINSSSVSVIQGGGYEYYEYSQGISVVRHIQVDSPIRNEFSPLRSNVRGKIAMAKTANPDSATSEWFINYADNSAALDNPNNSGGFTVFGDVIAGMNVVDAITNLSVQPSNLWISPSQTMPFNELPVINSFDPASDLDLNNKLVMVNRIPNVASTRTDLGTMPTFTADVDMAFDPAFVGTATKDYALKLLSSFSSPQNQSVHFNNGIHTMKVSGVMGSAGRIVTLRDGASVRPTHYYAYGATPDNPTPHWYDFAFDGTTGAEILGDKILLHFVDGQRGDEDLTANSITHTGAQAVVTTTGSNQSAQSGGCSIATTPSKTPRGGDWVMVSLFLGMLALVRRRARRQFQRERVTNIASP